MKYHFTTQTHKVLSDLHTPISLYLKLRDMNPESVLLESSDFHANQNSKSYIALCPLARFKVANNTIIMQYPDGTQQEDTNNHVVEGLSQFTHQFDIQGEYNHECGLFGYTSFEAVRFFDKTSITPKDNGFGNIPEMLYILYKYVLVINHFTDELTLIEILQKGEQSNISHIESLINNRNYASYAFAICGSEYSPITDDEYCNMVKQGIAHAYRGDVFQIVLSRRFQQAFKGDDFNVYRTLRSINPSPYLFYFNFGGFRIFGSSPETHCLIKDNRISIDPIAGTFKRTGDIMQDKILANQLLNDPKENAEHVMLVDLARNDLSRNASQVQVDFFREVQYYSHVIHLVSRVSGQLNENSNLIKAFADTFPAGTLSGAPKIRALQLIADIESHARGIYGGCIGFIGFNGNLNQAITIRSFVSKDHCLYYQAGAGIVAHSNAISELHEVNHKLGALRKALILATEVNK